MDNEKSVVSSLLGEIMVRCWALGSCQTPTPSGSRRSNSISSPEHDSLSTAKRSCVISVSHGHLPRTCGVVAHRSVLSSVLVVREVSNQTSSFLSSSTVCFDSIRMRPHRLIRYRLVSFEIQGFRPNTIKSLLDKIKAPSP